MWNQVKCSTKHGRPDQHDTILNSYLKNNNRSIICISLIYNNNKYKKKMSNWDPLFENELHLSNSYFSKLLQIQNLHIASSELIYDMWVIAYFFLIQKSIFCLVFLLFTIFCDRQAISLYTNWRFYSHFVVAG